MAVVENYCIRQRFSPEDPKGVRRLSLEKDENISIHRTIKSTVNLDETSSDRNEFQMKRHIGLFTCVAFAVGSVIGSGIFISSGNVLKSIFSYVDFFLWFSLVRLRVQSPGLCLVVWGTCGLYALLGALAYCEIGTLIPKSGGEYIYLLEAFGSTHKFFGPILAFKFIWVTGLLRRPMSTALLSLSLARYVSSPILKALDFCPDSYLASIINRLIACLFVGFIAFINCLSAIVATRVQNIFTVAKLTAIAIIIGGGLYKLSLGYTETLKTGFEGSVTTFGEIAQGFYGCLFTYRGWNALTYITEEVENPSRNLPLALIIAIPLTTVCYVLVNLSYLTVLTPQEIIFSGAVAESWADKVLGPAAFLIPLGVVISVFGTVNSSMFTAGRIYYVAGREGHIPDFLSYIHSERRTPIPSILLNSFLGVLMIIQGNIGKLMDYFSFVTSIFDCAVMAALITMRFTRKDQHRPVKVPIIIPIIVMLSSACLVAAPIILDPQVEYLYVILFIFSGIFFYVPFVYLKKTLPGMQRVTIFLQKIFMVAPTTGQ